MELSLKERLFLYNQYEILKLLNPDDEYEKKRYEECQKIVVEGYKYNYEDLTEGFEDDVSDEVCNFVWDVLQMYRTLNNSYYDLEQSEKDKINLYDITYKGFDGNEEGQYYSYSKFVLKDMGRYEEIYKDGKAELNSHHNVLNRYSKMLNKWQELNVSRYDNLTLEQIKYIISN